MLKLKDYKVGKDMFPPEKIEEKQTWYGVFDLAYGRQE
jgi:hypothetical protein